MLTEFSATQATFHMMSKNINLRSERGKKKATVLSQNNKTREKKIWKYHRWCRSPTMRRWYSILSGCNAYICVFASALKAFQPRRLQYSSIQASFPYDHNRNQSSSSVEKSKPSRPLRCLVLFQLIKYVTRAARAYCVSACNSRFQPAFYTVNHHHNLPIRPRDWPEIDTMTCINVQVVCIDHVTLSMFYEVAVAGLVNTFMLDLMKHNKHRGIQGIERLLNQLQISRFHLWIGLDSLFCVLTCMCCIFEGLLKYLELVWDFYLVFRRWSACIDTYPHHYLSAIDSNEKYTPR